jgi:hypothetical protein
MFVRGLGCAASVPDITGQPRDACREDLSLSEAAGNGRFFFGCSANMMENKCGVWQSIQMPHERTCETRIQTCDEIERESVQVLRGAIVQLSFAFPALRRRCLTSSKNFRKSCVWKAPPLSHFLPCTATSASHLAEHFVYLPSALSQRRGKQSTASQASSSCSCSQTGPGTARCVCTAKCRPSLHTESWMRACDENGANGACCHRSLSRKAYSDYGGCDQYYDSCRDCSEHLRAYDAPGPPPKAVYEEMRCARCLKLDEAHSEGGICHRCRVCELCVLWPRVLLCFLLPGLPKDVRRMIARIVKTEMTFTSVFWA